MRTLNKFCLGFFVVAALAVSACASIENRSYQNFKRTMEGQVGRDISDPYILRNRDPNLLVNTKILPNGNLEEEFKIGRRHNCRVFFELDNAIGKTVRWRYEGSDEDCVIVP